MKIYEIGTGYTSIPAKVGAATEIVVEELSKVFDKEKINYEIIDVEDDNRKDTHLKIKPVHIPKFLKNTDTSLGIFHKLKRVIYSINLARTLKKEIKKSSDKIVLHFHNQYNLYFFYKLTSKKLRKKVKIAYTVHSYIWNDEWDNISSTIKKRYFQEVFCVKKADIVYVLNNITIKHFVNHLNIDKNKIIKIDDGVNTEVYKPDNNEKKDFIFFQCGSVCERKNQLGAIKNLTSTLKKHKDYKYLYAGGIIDSNYKKSIDDYAKENNIDDQINYVGEINPGKDLSKYYNMAKAFIFPSSAEAFGMVILESMACGVPVIMNKKTIHETLTDLEDIILFYESQEEFDGIIKNKIENEKERKKISNLSRKMIERKYSWDIIAKKHADDFEKII